MNKSNRSIHGPAVVARVLMFSLVWWVLTDGAVESWWIGAPAVACALIVSMALLPPLNIVWREAISFAAFFLWHSLKGGVDVARLVFDPRMPIAPQLVDYPLRLPAGLAQVALINTMSLLPGTLSAGLDGRLLTVHVLDGRREVLSDLVALERRVGRVWGISVDDAARG